MAKLVGLSGPQGGGKTTLLDGLRGRGIEVDDFKVSREVQRQLGWATLDRVMESPETMIKFQVKVRDVKYVRELENLDRTDVDLVLTERTFADVVTYTQLWTWELVDQGKWELSEAVGFLVDFVGVAHDNQKVYSGNLILPSMPHVKFSTDPHRAAEKHVGFFTSQMGRFFDEVHPRNIPTFTVTEKSVEDRIQQAHNWINTI